MVLSVSVIHEYQRVPVQTIAGQDDHHREIRNQQQQVKTIRVVQPLEGLIKIMSAEVMQKAALRGSQKQNAGTDGIQESLREEKNTY